MNSLRVVLAGLLFITVGLIPVVAADAKPASPSKVVDSLYRASLAHSNDSDATSLGYAKPYISPDLWARIQKKLNQPVAKGDAPDIEGDLFLDAQDVPTGFLVGTTTVADDKAQVIINLRWANEKRRYSVYLQQIDGAWKVTDVNYGKDGKLSDLLK